MIKKYGALTCAALAATVLAATPAVAQDFPETIPLATGSLPEGIAGGPGTTFFAGARSDGAVYRGDLRTGTRELLVPGQAGRIAVGMQYDDASGLLWVAGGTTGAVTAYDGATGRQVYRAVVPGNRFLNDVDVTDDAVYVTDSRSRQLVVVELRGSKRKPAAPRLLTVGGDFAQPATGNGLNGIRAYAGGLVVVSVGVLYLVDPATGTADRIELTGLPSPTTGDGLELVGDTLYVTYAYGSPDYAIAAVSLAPDGRSGVVTRVLRDDQLDRPTTSTFEGGYLWSVNGRFDDQPGPTTTHDVVRVSLG